MDKFDFGGWATKNDLKCADGRIIRRDAFKEADGKKVPLVYQHLRNSVDNVLGHALLENRPEGVYAYLKFNNTENGKIAKEAVSHGDLTALSIYANGLVEKSKEVLHGIIREVSLVLAGANPGALIDNLTMSHSDDPDDDTPIEDEAIISTGLTLTPYSEIKHDDASNDGEETVADVLKTFTEKQQNVLNYIVGQLEVAAPTTSSDASNAAQHSNDEEGDIVKHNVFDKGTKPASEKKRLTREDFGLLLADAKKLGSFKESFMAHAEDLGLDEDALFHAGDYGIDNIGYLFPDARSVTPTPEFVSRDMSWVMGVINGTRHSRFSRIKSLSADITPDAARALGYVTGNLKKEEVFALQKRETTPQTIYKKQKLDRDDILDITDMDVVAWMKAEMRVMLNEEIARAILVGDGRDPVADADDKIDETHVRPIYTDDANMYVVSTRLAYDATIAAQEEAIVRARTSYKGSGNPVMYAGPTFITDLLLQKDTTGRRYYMTEAELASALRVSRIVEVPVMDNLNRESTQTTPITMNLKAIIVNLQDYVVGADKGGEVNFFDDFDIDYNQFKYLLETRISGALVKPKSAIVVEMDAEEDTN